MALHASWRQSGRRTALVGVNLPKYLNSLAEKTNTNFELKHPLYLLVLKCVLLTISLVKSVYFGARCSILYHVLVQGTCGSIL